MSESNKDEAGGTFSPYSSVSEEGEDKPDNTRTKRSRDHDFESGDRPNSPCDFNDSISDEPPSKRREASSRDVLFRIVVPSRQIGKVIGKQGSRIRRIREETRATIKIADAVARHEERVIIISSRDDDNAISDAESALNHIARVILQENEDGPEAPRNGLGHEASNVIKLLITRSQAGCLIGISGQSIEKIRNSSGATITILAQNQLPFCASAHESDRLVQVSGELQEVLKALEQIGCKLRENPPKKVISIRPTHNIGSARPNSSNMPLSSVEHVTSEMLIPETLVGGLIGKHGCNISRIRNESGATIKVTGGRAENEQRLIHFLGTPQQVAIAKVLVERSVYDQLLQPRGGS